MIPVTTFAGKTVAVFGMGGSGVATAKALAAGGATVAAWDDSAGGRDAARKSGIPVVDLTTADWSTFAALVLAPGVPLTHPEPHWTVRKAIAAQIEIIGDIELFCRERDKLSGSVSAQDPHAPDAPFIAITGTNGKSTTTSLVAHILRNAGLDVQMGGNIGVPILALEPPALDRFHVIEMSSFQIDLTPSLNPTIGVLLNITPDHIDRHGTLENYAAIKERLVMAAGKAVIGVEDGLGAPGHICEGIFRTLDTTPGRVVAAFTHKPAKTTGIVSYRPPLLSRAIASGLDACVTENLVDLTGATALRGAHNAENAAAAFLVCEMAGVPHDDIGAAIKTYPGLAHRMEEIGRIGPVLLINDSKATNADSTEKALLSFPDDIYWIVGGKPKEGGIDPLVPLFPRIAKAYLIGAASDEFAATLEPHAPYERCGTLEIALAKAVADATRDSALSDGASPPPDNRHNTLRVSGSPPPRGEGLGVEGNGAVGGSGALKLSAMEITGVARRQPVVLLSPACASYDQFKSFEHRGDTFRTLASALPGFTPRSKA